MARHDRTVRRCLHRLHDDKREVRVYDYADLNVPLLARMFGRRCRGYEAIGYTVLLPASAIPGVACGRRAAIRSRLEARLFEQRAPVGEGWRRFAACEPLPSCRTTGAAGPEGAQRARSASEAFLFRRLETLLATRGQLAVNTKLPIPFDGAGSLEIDLLCAEARVAVELDGAQHLADRVASNPEDSGNSGRQPKRKSLGNEN